MLVLLTWVQVNATRGPATVVLVGVLKINTIGEKQSVAVNVAWMEPVDLLSVAHLISNELIFV